MSWTWSRSVEEVRDWCLEISVQVGGSVLIKSGTDGWSCVDKNEEDHQKDLCGKDDVL